MPVQSWGHEAFWAHGDTAITPVSTVVGGGYPAWQASVITPSLFGGLQAGWDVGSEHVKSWAEWIARLWRLPPGTRVHLGALMDRLEDLDPDRRFVIEQALKAVEHPAYPQAVKAVGVVAVTPGMKDKNAQVAISRKIHERPGWAENMYRHLAACDLADITAREAGSTMTNPELNLIVELAYHTLRLK